MKDIRCPHCGRLLLKAVTVIGNIKCPKCYKIVKLTVVSQQLQFEKETVYLNYNLDKRPKSPDEPE